MIMDLSNLHPAPGSRRDRKRLGRGYGSGRGKTAGKGTKGQKARAGAHVPGYFEGGQNSLVHRLPVRRGLHNKQPTRIRPVTINLSDLRRFPEGADVTAETLVEAGLVGRRARLIKVLGDGELSRALTVTANKFSASAKAKIEAAGGRAIVRGAANGGNVAANDVSSSAATSGADKAPSAEES